MSIHADEPVHISEAQPDVRPRFHARQVGGVPDVHTISLLPLQLSDGLYPCTAKNTGLYVGTTVRKDGFIAFLSPVIPKMRFKTVKVIVEFTDADEHPGITLCKFTLFYLDRKGECCAQSTKGLVANGDKFGWVIPAHHVRTEFVLPISLKVELLSPLEHVDEMGEKRTHRPVLIRGAWLEIPE